MKNLSKPIRWLKSKIEKAHTFSPKRFAEGELQVVFLEEKNLLACLELLEEKIERWEYQNKAQLFLTYLLAPASRFCFCLVETLAESLTVTLIMNSRVSNREEIAIAFSEYS